MSTFHQRHAEKFVTEIRNKEDSISEEGWIYICIGFIWA